MSTGRITKRSVDAHNPTAGEAVLWDDELRGFGLRATSKGAKSYVLQYRMGGRESPTRRYTIGRHGSPWTPEKARKEAERLLIMVRQGIDPVQADQERRRQAVDLAFEAYAQSFVELYLKKRWKQWKLGEGLLRREVVSVLRRKPLPTIKRADLNPIWDGLRDRPSVARLTHATLRKLFRWAVSRGDIDRSPLEGVEAPPSVAARDRVLTDQELALAWHAVGNLGQPFTGFYRMLMLTGQRREEVAGMDWSELDQSESMWTIPGFRTKNGKPQLVPLSDMAVIVVGEFACGKAWPTSGLVFSTTGRTPISGFSKAKRRLDEIMCDRAKGHYEIPPWRAHDIRRTVATGLQRLGVRFEVTEAILNHVSGSKAGVAGVYQRHDWKPEKREALNAWAGLVERIIQ